MKRTAKVFLSLWLVAIIASLFGLRLIVTRNLLDWATEGDPAVQTLHAAYTRGDTIILDYTTEASGMKDAMDGMSAIDAKGARYWAVLPLPPRDMSPQYMIHRRPITPADVRDAVAIPVVDLRGHIQTDEWDRMDHDQIRAFIRPRFTAGKQEVYFHRSSHQIRNSNTVFSETTLYIPMTNPHHGTMELFGNHPHDTYIPFSRRVVLVVAWPLAVLGDWLTAPLIPFSLGFGWK